MEFKSLFDYTAAELPPNPQFFRDGWIDLCGAWGFAHDDAEVGIDERWFERSDIFTRTIVVPFPPESRASGIHDPSDHPVVWYRRTFTIERQGDERVVLNFGAVDYLASVWVNGRLVAKHEGGHTPFSADITCELNASGEQVLVVRAEDQPLDMSQPRGKQDWLPDPHIIWYYRTTGIWQPVWLEKVAPVHINEVRWTPRLHRLGLRLIAQLSRTPKTALRMRVRLWLHGALLIDDTCLVRQRELGREFILPISDLAMQLEDILWSPEHPNLIEAELSLIDEEGRVIDALRTYTGLRSASVGNGRFLLNGRPYYLRSVLEQGYWPESHLVAPSPDALLREVELIKELGFNSVRIHQKVEDPRFLYWCDVLGLAVWGEMANTYAYTWLSAERLTREWMEVLKRDFSHPSIVTWVPVNESWGVPTLAQDERQREHLRALYALTKSFDPTRPVVDNDGWEHVRTDIVTIHDYSKNGQTLRERYGTDAALTNLVQTGRPLHYPPLLEKHLVEPDAPVMLTEFGGISYEPQPDTKWFGYGTVTTVQEYVEKIRELVVAVLDCPGIVGYCYTQLTDTEQETNGLLDENRKPKFDVAVIRSIFGPREHA
jgi:beta-galactosidase/beta-glucuronidase